MVKSNSGKKVSAKKETKVWYKRIPLFIIPLLISAFFYFQPDYVLDCNLRSDRCIIQKKATIFSEMEKDKVFNISDIESWKIFQNKKFGFIETNEYYLSLRMYNHDYFKLKQFPVDSEKMGKRMYIKLSKGEDYHRETQNKLANEILFFFFIIAAGLMAVYTYGIKRV